MSEIVYNKLVKTAKRTALQEKRMAEQLIDTDKTDKNVLSKSLRPSVAASGPVILYDCILYNLYDLNCEY